MNPLRARRISWRRAAVAFAATALLAGAPAGADSDADTRALREAIEQLTRENAHMREELEALRREVRDTREIARAAADPQAAPPPVSAAAGGLQLLDLSLDALVAAGGSSAPDDTLALLQAGDHDPRQRGFTLQQAELSLQGAVDPFFTGEVHLIYFLDPEGESRFELEEAFLTTQALPFRLAERGLQLEVGHFFTEFGRTNPRHPHTWHWLDQPIVLSRLFGGDGLRGPGARLGWLLPVPWFSELHVGAQNADGETMLSFLASEETFAERAIGGRPFAPAGTRGAADLTTLVRWVNGLDLGDTWSTQLGLSWLSGPNATGGGARTHIVGADVVAKWRPLATDQGWPFLIFEAEVMARRYEADRFVGCPVAEEASGCPVTPVALAADVLRDRGAYAQVLWGVRRGWALGLRGGWAGGSGDGVAFDETLGSFVVRDRDEDPFRSDRWRVSPLLVYQPSEYSRLRLQYSYDHADFLDGQDAHALWAGFEVLFGSHPAHAY